MKINCNFTFKNYKIFKINKNLNSKFLILSNNDNNIIKLLLNENVENLLFSKEKVTNKAFVQIISISVFKNFKRIIQGQIFFIELYENKKKINSKKISLLNSLILKLNNKIYSSKKLSLLNFLTYKENLILFFQFNISGIKCILKS